MIRNLFKLIRLPQWIKNLFVFAPLIFSQHLFEFDYAFKVTLAFVSFCFLSSIVYIINDIFDLEADKAHPEKKKRPIPSGSVSVSSALVIVGLLSIGLIFLIQYLNYLFNYSLLLYLIINFFYSWKLKHIVILDVFSVASGFMIRVIAGALVINVEESSWLVLTTMFLSLFLAVMKRRSELVLNDVEEHASRKVLEFYSIGFADQMGTIAAGGIIICYALYTLSDRTVAIFNTENLIYTTPFVAFGIFRYMFLVHKNQKGENATETMLTDVPMIVNIIFYSVITVFIIY